MKIQPIMFLRIGLPAMIAIVGVALLIVGNDSGRGAGVALLGVALIVALLNFFFVMSVKDTADREREENARTWYSEHYRWPDEDDK